MAKTSSVITVSLANLGKGIQTRTSPRELASSVFKPGDKGARGG